MCIVIVAVVAIVAFVAIISEANISCDCAAAAAAAAAATAIRRPYHLLTSPMLLTHVTHLACMFTFTNYSDYE